MPDFLAYVIGPDGHVSRRIDLDCDDGDTAKAYAKSLVDGLHVDLWEGARLVESYP
jgi:hypothetical protein